MIQLAAIFTKAVTYFAQYEPIPQEPHTAATQLIQGLYEKFPDKALHILRNKIYLNYQPGLLCRGMISIAAKRYEVRSTLGLNSLSRFDANVEITFTSKKSSVTWQETSFEEVLNWLRMKEEPYRQSIYSSVPHFARNRPVRAILLDAENQVILAAENQNSNNKTLHAEVILLQDYFQKYKKGFTSPVTLLTNLQCCKMCAAMIWYMHSEPWNQLKVVYLKPENGPSARDTILTSNGNLRREFAGQTQNTLKQIEFSFQNSPLSKRC